MTEAASHRFVVRTEEEVSVAIEEVVARVAAQGVPFDRCEDIRTAMTEACANAREYAHHSAFEVRLRSDHGKVTIEVEDHGPPFTLPERRPDMEARMLGRERPRGWGLFMIGQLADASSVVRMADGNVLRMQFNVSPVNGGTHRG